MSALAERIAAVTGVAPIGELSRADRTELEELVGRAEALEDLPGRWQAAVLEAELRAAGDEPAAGHGHCCHH